MNRKTITNKIIIVSAMIGFLSLQPVFAAYQSPEADQFMTGFNAFKKKDYSTAISQLTSILNMPDSQLRELALVFMARAQFKSGKTDEAAYALHIWKEEFPKSTLTSSLEQDLVKETSKIDVKVVIARKELERVAREKAEVERIAREKAEFERLAREKAEAEKLANHKAFIYTAVKNPEQVLSLPTVETTATAAIETLIPIEIKNPGLIPDQFSLSAKMPKGVKAIFKLNGNLIESTDEIQPGAASKLQLAVTLPPDIFDGQPATIQVIAKSKLASELMISSDLKLAASAPIVRAVVKKIENIDNDTTKARCLVSVLNVGSADAAALKLNVSHSSAYELVSETLSGFRKSSETLINSSPEKISTGELKEFTIDFRLKGKESAKEGIACKASIVLE